MKKTDASTRQISEYRLLDLIQSIEPPLKTLFFDFDGTIHDSIQIYYPAFLKGYEYLVEKGIAEPKVFTPAEVSHWLGYNSVEMWKNFMPDCPEVHQDAARKIIGTEMQKQLEMGGGILYEGAEECLERLKNQGYTLVFLSNCGESYMETARRVFALDRFFSYYYCSAMFDQLPKSEILKRIKPEFEGPMAIIGDRFHDMEAGQMNQVITIGCLYGYGKAEEFIDADYTIKFLGDGSSASY